MGIGYRIFKNERVCLETLGHLISTHKLILIEKALVWRHLDKQWELVIESLKMKEYAWRHLVIYMDK